MIDLYLNKQFDFSVPLTSNRSRLLTALINRRESLVVASTVTTRLLTIIAILLAKANFEKPDRLIDNIHEDEKHYLHLLDPHIFTNKDNTEADNQKLYEEYKKYMESLNK